MKIRMISISILICLLLSACGGSQKETPAATLPHIGPDPSITTQEHSETDPESEEQSRLQPIETGDSAPGTEPGTEALTSGEQTTEPVGNGYFICIDAGHQGHANTDTEPVGPGSAEMKTKVSTGTQGRTSGVPEYVVNLEVALKLQKILEERGYRVLMIRTTHDVNISNVERAQIANEAGVDAFVRIHCNGVDDTSVDGVLAMCQTRSNPWNGAAHDEYYRLCQSIVDEICAVTGAANRGVLETDTMTGINWCEVPTALVEMGFMTNPEEDLKLVDDAYQDQLALGIANGLDAFFGISR